MENEYRTDCVLLNDLGWLCRLEMLCLPFVHSHICLRLSLDSLSLISTAVHCHTVLVITVLKRHFKHLKNSLSVKMPCNPWRAVQYFVLHPALSVWPYAGSRLSVPFMTTTLFMSLVQASPVNSEPNYCLESWTHLFVSTGQN